MTYRNKNFGKSPFDPDYIDGYDPHEDRERYELEQEKIKAVEVTKAEQEREVSKLAAEKAEFDKKRIVAEGQAEAEANRLKVAAGLTPQERAEWDYKTAVGIAEALSKSNVRWVPEIMISGQGSGSTNAMDAVGMNMMLDIADLYDRILVDVSKTSSVLPLKNFETVLEVTHCDEMDRVHEFEKYFPIVKTHNSPFV